ncbi:MULTISPECIES: carboxymuconolactone decarboxylase family protein [unclassified Agarivorans]|uniref:carboxymuconolactone decarboxylase family protein n=1 Tax=unclassified Agarivorans TaxID=2636026 RepID=UPI003D7E6C73
MNNTEQLFRYAPKLKQLSEQVLFADVWQRPLLSPRERSLITLAALAALGRTEQLPFHLTLAEKNSLTKEELGELFTHLAFYAGWPAAVSSLSRIEPQE